MANSLPIEKLYRSKLCILVIKDAPVLSRTWLLEFVVASESAHKHFLVLEQATSRVLYFLASCVHD